MTVGKYSTYVLNTEKNITRDISHIDVHENERKFYI